MSEVEKTSETKSSAVRVQLGDDDLGVFDMAKLSNQDMYLIESQFGLTTKQFIDGIGEMRAVAIDALIWLMYRRKERIVDKNLIRWTFGDLNMSPDESVGPTEANSGTDAATGSELSPTSAI